MELCQETIQSKNEVLPFCGNYDTPWKPSKKWNQTNEHQLFNLRGAIPRVFQLHSAACKMNTSWVVLPGKKSTLNTAFFWTPYLAVLPEAWLVLKPFYKYLRGKLPLLWVADYYFFGFTKNIIQNNFVWQCPFSDKLN